MTQPTMTTEPYPYPGYNPDSQTNCDKCKYVGFGSGDRPKGLPDNVDYTGITFTCEKGQTDPGKKCPMFEAKEPR